MTGVMRQHHNPGPTVERDLVHQVSGPADQQAVGARKALFGDEWRPGVHYCDPVAHLGPERRESLADVDGAEHQQVRWGSQGLEEDRMLVVVESAVLFVTHQGDRILGHICHDAVGEGTCNDLSGAVHDRFLANGRPSDDRCHRAKLLGVE